MKIHPLKVTELMVINMPLLHHDFQIMVIKLLTVMAIISLMTMKIFKKNHGGISWTALGVIYSH